MNSYIGSDYESETISLAQRDRRFTACSHGKRVGVQFRIPEYAKDFRIILNGRSIPFIMKMQGYALVERVWHEGEVLEISFETPVRRIFANPAVRADVGTVAFTRGAAVFCAEGIDNDGDVDFCVAEDPALREVGEKLIGKRADGGEFTLIPFAKRCNRGSTENADRRMSVWLGQENMPNEKDLAAVIGNALYAELK